MFVVSCQGLDFLAPKHCIAQHKLDTRVIPNRISSMSLAEVDYRRPCVSLQDSHIFVALLHSSTITCLPTPMVRPHSVAFSRRFLPSVCRLVVMGSCQLVIQEPGRGHPTFERRNSLIRSRTVLISCEGDMKRVIRQLYMADGLVA